MTGRWHRRGIPVPPAAFAPSGKGEPGASMERMWHGYTDWPGSRPMTIPGDSPEAAQVDLELVRGVLAGDADARAAFARRMRCVPRILSAINFRRSAALGAQDLEDLAQDSLVRILEKLETYRGHTTLEYWVHRFCYLQTMNWVRRRGRRAEKTSRLESDIEAEGRETPQLDPGELEELMEQMHPREAEAVRLRLFEELDFDQIGELLDIPPATAKSRYYRGISWLQRRVRQQPEDSR